MVSSLQYTQMNLDRADALRQSPEQIAKLWTDPDCRVLPMQKNTHLVSAGLDPITATHAELNALGIVRNSGSFLGLDNNTPYFSMQCNDEQALQWCASYSDTSFVDLRIVGPTLANSMASILAYARGLSHWQSNNNYCTKCGAANELIAAGHTMKCTSCESLCFPRTDPAVIMMVEHTDSMGQRKCLLGRSPAWPTGCLSTLAGFVETGESLEAAVIREVFEETGIRVVNPTYVVSQPWPFPQSIMLGFIASAKNTDIVIDKNELSEAHWFSADEVHQFGEWADEGSGPKLPRQDSIARLLINQWLASLPKTAAGKR